MNLKRATRDRWVFGVCGGVAHAYGWSSNVVRLAVALLALFIPGPNLVVLVAYVLLGIFLPETNEF